MVVGLKDDIFGHLYQTLQHTRTNHELKGLFDEFLVYVEYGFLDLDLYFIVSQEFEHLSAHRHISYNSDILKNSLFGWKAGIDNYTPYTFELDIQILITDGLDSDRALREIDSEAQVLLEEESSIDDLVELSNVLEVQLLLLVSLGNVLIIVTCIDLVFVKIKIQVRVLDFYHGCREKIFKGSLEEALVIGLRRDRLAAINVGSSRLLSHSLRNCGIAFIEDLILAGDFRRIS